MQIFSPRQRISLNFNNYVLTSLEKLGGWPWGGKPAQCPELSPRVLHSHLGGMVAAGVRCPSPASDKKEVGEKSWGSEKGPRENTYWYCCPQNNRFQRKGISHLWGFGGKFKNIMQVQPKCLENGKQKRQKLFGGLGLQVGFKSPNSWSFSSLSCLRNDFQMAQLAVPMTYSTTIFFSLLSWWKVTAIWENIPWQMVPLSGPSHASFTEAAKPLREKHF